MLLKALGLFLLVILAISEPANAAEVSDMKFLYQMDGSTGSDKKLYFFQRGSSESCYLYEGYRNGGLQCNLTSKTTKPTSVANIKYIVSDKSDNVVVRLEMGNGDLCYIYDGYGSGGLQCRFRSD